MDNEETVKEYLNASIETRLDIAEMALSIAVINNEPWAIKFTLENHGKTRGYNDKNNDPTQALPEPIKVEIIAEDARRSDSKD